MILSCLFAAAFATISQAQHFINSLSAPTAGQAMASAGTDAPDTTPKAPVYNPNARTCLPQFPGGEKSMLTFMDTHLQYPKMAKLNSFEGKVVVRATVAANGTLEKIEVKNPVDPILDAAAIEAVKAMPKWLPALQMGRPVKCNVNIPVNFSLN